METQGKAEFVIAEAKDAAVIGALRQQIWRATYRGVYPDEVIDVFDFEKHRQRDLAKIADPAFCVYLIRSSEENIGYFIFQNTGSSVALHSLYMLPAYQHRGIGKRAFSIMREYGREREIRQITCSCNPHNENALCFYRRMGGIVTHTDIGNENKQEDEVRFSFDIEGVREAAQPRMLFETDRLLVRRFREEDAAALFAVLSDPEVMKYIEPPFSTARTEAFIRQAGLCEPPLVYAVVWKATGALIGQLIWHDWDEGVKELGWILRRDYWGRGIATELSAAAIEKSERSIVIECSPAQTATRRIAERLGFRLAEENEELLVYMKEK